MTLNFKFKKIYFKKAYLAFFAAVPLLTMLSLINVPCPICGGTGEISSTGMGDVVVAKIDYSLKAANSVDTCLSYKTYDYDVIMTVQNNSKTTDASGYINLALVDYNTNRVLDSRPTEIVVPASSEVTKLFPVRFGVPLDSPTTTQIVAEPIYTKIDCKACNGTGKIALNALPFVSLMKDQITRALSVNIVPVVPPEQTEISEFDIGQEYNTDQWAILHPDGQ
jgi:hypothetical protein